MSKINRRAAPSPKNAASKTNANEHTTGTERTASVAERYGARFGANVGFLIYVALVLGALGREIS
jgi:hypothetical protein